MEFLKRLAEWFNGPPRPRRTCGQLTRDELVREGRERSHYCRVHLVEEFARGFEKAPYRMVVYEFQPQATKYTGAVYAYYPVSSLREFCWSIQDADRLKCVLAAIDTSQLCQFCGGNSWQVVYFDHDTAPWQEEAALPDIGIDRALRLCTRCAALKLVPVLRENPDEYDEGLYVPYREDGMYMTTEM